MTELEGMGWDVTVQEFPHGEGLGFNLIANQRRGISNGAGKQYVLIAAHYDTRPYADQDPDPALRTKPVPGANDGGSGVAVLLELARVLATEDDLIVQLVFFDAEDSGGIDGKDWIVGSTYFAQSLEDFPDAVFVLDMIGDAEQNIYLEKNSDPILAAEIWGTATELEIESFIFEEKYSMMDDHSPFISLVFQLFF